MKTRNIIFLSLLFGIFHNLYSQSEDLSITKSHGRFYQSGQVMTYYDLESLLKSFPESEKQIRKSNSNYNIAFPILIFSSIGVLAGSGVTIVSALQKTNTDDKENTGYSTGLKIMGISGAVGVVGITFSVAAGYHKKKAVRIYNSNIKNADAHPELLNFNFSPNSVGLKVSF